MAVASTLSGYTRQCGRQSGGVATIGLIPVADISDITVTDGVITAITMATGKYFKKYDSELDQAEYKFSGSEASILIRFNRNSAASSKAYNELVNAAPCGLAALVKMNNGEAPLIGYTEEFKFERPITSIESDASSGKAITDPNYFDVTLKTTQVVAPLYLSDSVDIEALFGAAA